jgi:hypothetical protein
MDILKCSTSAGKEEATVSTFHLKRAWERMVQWR